MSILGRGEHSHTWRWYRTFLWLTPICDIFVSWWILILWLNYILLTLPYAEKTSLSLSLLVQKIIWPKGGLIFHQNLSFDSFESLCIKFFHDFWSWPLFTSFISFWPLILTKSRSDEVHFKHLVKYPSPPPWCQCHMIYMNLTATILLNKSDIQKCGFLSMCSYLYIKAIFTTWTFNKGQFIKHYHPVWLKRIQLPFPIICISWFHFFFFVTTIFIITQNIEYNVMEHNTTQLLKSITYTLPAHPELMFYATHLPIIITLNNTDPLHMIMFKA